MRLRQALASTSGAAVVLSMAPILLAHGLQEAFVGWPFVLSLTASAIAAGGLVASIPRGGSAREAQWLFLLAVLWSLAIATLLLELRWFRVDPWMSADMVWFAPVSMAVGALSIHFLLRRHAARTAGNPN